MDEAARVPDEPTRDAGAGSVPVEGPAQGVPDSPGGSLGVEAPGAADALATAVEVAERDAAEDDGAPSGEAGSDAGDEASADASDAASGHAGDDASGSPAGKRKRRRKPKKEAPQGPLARFVAHGPRRHAFAVGEVVAGRVLHAESGVIAVDLFGKAVAFVDEHEPREPPPLPEPPSAAASASPGAADPETLAADAAPAQATSGAPGDATDADADGEDGAATESAPEEEAASDAAAPTSDDFAWAAAGVEADAAAEASADTGTRNAGAGPADDDDDDDASAAESGADGAAAKARPERTPLPIAPAPAAPLDAPVLGHIFRGRVGAVAESGHLAIVNRLVDAAAVRADLERCRESRRRVQGLVFGYNRGGFDVLVAGIRAFCPVRAMSLEPIDDPDVLVGRRLEFLIPTFQPLGRDIVVSRRSILEREQRKRAREFVRTLRPGQRLHGRVTQVFEFGLLVDIGGAEGLVHQSELSWARGVRPADVAVPGDEVDVQVLRIGDPGGKPGPGRRDRIARVALSIRALLPDPWANAVAELGEGTVRKGKVVRATEFGAFVELVPSIEGLLHVSELGRDVKHAGDVLKAGDEIHVVIEHVDERARRIALGKPSASEIQDQEQGKLGGPDAPKNLRPGARVKVRVEKLEHRGMLVRVVGLAGRRARGFLAKSDLGEREGDHRRAFPVGSEIDVKIVGFDREGELKFSVKALQIDEERRAVKDYRREAATKGFGTFGDLLRAKLGETPK
jgi:small subunit ribosomal protein S1